MGNVAGNTSGAFVAEVDSVFAEATELLDEGAFWPGDAILDLPVAWGDNAALWSGSPGRRDSAACPRDESVMASLLADAEAGQYEANRAAAARAHRLAEVFAFARARPQIYALAGDRDAVRTAERCVALEAAVRLRMSENAVRNLAALAEAARERMPRLWAMARDGFATIAQVEAACEQLPAFETRPDVLVAFDDQAARLAAVSSTAAFRRRVRAVARRLAPQPAAERHAEAMARRRVIVEPAEAGMCWLTAYIPLHDGHAITRRLTATAKHMSGVERAGRTRDEIRADLLRDLLTGKDTATAVRTTVFVTVPLDRLTAEARATVRPHVHGQAGLDLNAEPLIPGVGGLDDDTARALLCHAGRFTRVITDPVSGVVVDMDRRSRRATDAQRAWLALTHGVCVRDGCNRLAVDADVDHQRPWHDPGGRRDAGGVTNIGNLNPLCDPDHALKDTTRVRYDRRADGTVRLRFPTGHETRLAAPPGEPAKGGDRPPF